MIYTIYTEHLLLHYILLTIPYTVHYTISYLLHYTIYYILLTTLYYSLLTILYIPLKLMFHKQERTEQMMRDLTGKVIDLLEDSALEAVKV